MSASQNAAPTRDLGQIIFRNTLAVTIGRGAAKILNLLFIIYAVRVLGEAGLGRYATVVAFVGLGGVFFELGMAQYVERTVAQDRSRAQALFWNMVVLRLILAVVGVVSITAAAWVFNYDREIVAGIFLYSLTFILAAVLVPLTTILTANERFDLATAAQVVNQVLTIVFGVLFLWMGMGFFALLYTGFIAMPAQIVLMIWAIRRFQLGPLRVQLLPGTWPAFILASLPFGLTSLALLFNFNVDTIILGIFHDESTVGWYNAAYRLVFNTVGLVGGFLVAMTPSLAREHFQNPERVARWVRRTLHWMLLFSLPASAGLALLAPRVVLLLYGGSYAPSGSVLALIALDVPLLLLNSFFGNVTAAMNLERPAARIFLGSAGLNLVLNLLFIPGFGMQAAAAVTVVTDALSILFFYRLLRHHVEMDLLAPQVRRILGATVAMTVIVWLARSLPLPLAIASGATFYLLLALWLRLIDRSLVVAVFRRVVQRAPAVQP